MGRHATALGWALCAAGAIITAVGVVLVIDSGGDGAISGAPAPSPTSTVPADSSATATTAATTPPSTSAVATSSTAPTTSAPTTSTSTTVAATAPPTTVAADQAVRQFFAAFTVAIQSGDAAFLIAHLHPLVFDRYASEACAAHLAQLQLPDAAIDVVSVGPEGPWEWVTDGLTRIVDGVTSVATRTTSDGVSFTDATSHVVVGDDGAVQWFTDCGDPKQGAA